MAWKPLGDTRNEAPESFGVTLSAPTNATLADATGTGTIADNDPLPTLSLAGCTVDEGNAGLSRFEQIKKFAILPRDFSMAEGELTPTLKLKRRVCEEHFAAEIEALYS